MKPREPDCGRERERKGESELVSTPLLRRFSATPFSLFCSRLPPKRKKKEKGKRKRKIIKLSDHSSPYIETWVLMSWPRSRLVVFFFFFFFSFVEREHPAAKDASRFVQPFISFFFSCRAIEITLLDEEKAVK